MIKALTIFLILVNIGFSQTGLYGLDGWYYLGTVASAGSPGAVPNPDSDRVNPAGFATLTKQLQLNLIKYPAGINAQSVLFIKPIKKANFGFGLRHLGYGGFIEIDENGIENGTYSASDTWLSTTWAQSKQNISWGATGGFFFSSLESYSAIATVFSIGVLYDLTKFDTQGGFSISNYGFFLRRYTEYKEKLPTTIIISANKGLAHLPLNLNFDIGYTLHTNDTIWRFGGIFNLPYQLKLSFGINSNNISQRTEYNSVKSILGSSGVGLAYTYKQYSIEIGGYTFGSGGWIYGTGFNIKL